jgi:glutaredoxin 3
VAFTDVDVASDVAGRDELIRRTGQLAVPVIVVGDDVVVGFDRARLARLLGLAD